MGGKDSLPYSRPVDKGPVAATQVPHIELTLAVANHRVFSIQNL